METDYGYHIMLRLPLDPADYRSQFISQQMDVRAGQWKEVPQRPHYVGQGLPLPHIFSQKKNPGEAVSPRDSFRFWA